MRKLILCGAFVIAAAFSGQAQAIPENAIGIRLSAGDGIGADVSYQRRVFTNNRLEFDLGIREQDWYDTAKFVAAFHWVFPIEQGFAFYAGPGIGAGHWKFDRYNDPDNDWDDDGAFGVVTGVAGIEYKFAKIPLQLSFDIRPEVHFGDDRGDFDRDHNDFVPDIGLAVRYTF